jgi:osmotically-inducible protein OsmY
LLDHSFNGEFVMSKFYNLTFAAAFVASSVALAAPAAFAQDAAADAAETAAVQAAINQDLNLRVDRVHVQTIDGTVYLQGNVGSRASAAHAEELARSVPNVGKIVDALGDSRPSA